MKKKTSHTYISKKKQGNRRKTQKQHGGHFLKKQVKAIFWPSAAVPGKILHKVFVFDELDEKKTIMDELNKYIRNSILETEEEFLALHDNFKNSDKPKTPSKILVYGFNMTPK